MKSEICKKCGHDEEIHFYNINAKEEECDHRISKEKVRNCSCKKFEVEKDWENKEWREKELKKMERNKKITEKRQEKAEIRKFEVWRVSGSRTY